MEITVTVEIKKKRIRLVLYHPGDPQPPFYERPMKLTYNMTAKEALEIAGQLSQAANAVG